MEKLRLLNTISKYEFGVLNNTGVFKENFHLKFKNDKDLYILTDDDTKTQLITFRTRHGDAILHLENFELEIESGKVYYLKPMPPAMCLNDFDVQKYSYADDLEVNAVSEDQLDFVRERFIDCLKEEIGDKKLRMSCWPFDIDLETFLDECDIPHYIIIYMKDYCYSGPFHFIFDKFKDIETDENDRYPPRNFYVPTTDVTTNGQLFCNCNCLLKRIDYSHKQYIYNGSSITTGSYKENYEFEKAFVIFNPSSSNDVGEYETVLPSSSDCHEKIF